VRVAMLISFAACGLFLCAVYADDAFAQVMTGTRSGYIVPEEYAKAYQTELIASLTGPPKVEGFWTPSEANVVMAERVFREMLESAAKDPSILFPELAGDSNGKKVKGDTLDEMHNETVELGAILKNYDSYQRQYVGLIIGGNKIVYCNYSEGTPVDASKDYVFIQKVFQDGGRNHFLQAQVDSVTKVCTNVSFIGTWQSK
jgi:hypothetical protein